MLPDFDAGWIGAKGERAPFLTYAAAAANWSDELEAMHADSSRDHFLDVWTRTAILERVVVDRPGANIVDLGCSSGYLLADISRAHADALLIGVDLVTGGLRKAHALVPSARRGQADACNLPLADGSVDAIVSANLLEHIADDDAALREVRRVLRPGASATIVVPAGARTYDYYDRFLGHERRYAHGELATKASQAGLRVVEDAYIGSLLYPAFWLVKQRNRRLYGHLEGEQLERRGAADIENTAGSRVGDALRRIEVGLGLRLPFGIRNLVVLSAEPR